MRHNAASAIRRTFRRVRLGLQHQAAVEAGEQVVEARPQAVGAECGHHPPLLHQEDLVLLHPGLQAPSGRVPRASPSTKGWPAMAAQRSWLASTRWSVNPVMH
jgi:hypothetical protein